MSGTNRLGKHRRYLRICFGKRKQTTSMPLRNNFYRRILPDVCTSFSSERGKQLFRDALNAGYMESYFNLGPQLRTQDEPAYCGLSSLVMVLNALAVDPGIVWKGVWRWYHEDMLECCKPLEEVKTEGVTLDQLSCIARCNQLESQHYHTTEDQEIDEFRNLVKEACQTQKMAIIASFGRQVLKQTGTGHFAPIGGYSPAEDHVLILEPARFKYPPFWVPLSLFWKSMCTLDKATGKHRGYMILRKSNYQPTLLFKISKTFNAVSPTRDHSLILFNTIVEFLHSKTTADTEKENIKRICEKVFDISTTHYTDRGRGLFFNSLTGVKVGELSSEHQEAVFSLVKEVESLQLYKLINSTLSDVVCCQTLFKVEDSTKQCCNHDNPCVLCLPHYMTIFLLVLPVFVRTNEIPSSDRQPFEIDKADCEGTYFEVVLNSAKELTTGNMDSSERLLLSNEVEQLQKQVVSVLNTGKSASCCGIKYI